MLDERKGSALSSVGDPQGNTEAPPLVVTDTARAEICRLLEKRKIEGKPVTGLRVGIRGGGCTGFSYLFEWAVEPPTSRDAVIQINGEVAMFVDPKSLVYLRGMRLDFVKSMMGHGFQFHNPNAKGSCGCGESVQF